MDGCDKMPTVDEAIEQIKTLRAALAAQDRELAEANEHREFWKDQCEVEQALLAEAKAEAERLKGNNSCKDCLYLGMHTELAALRKRCEGYRETLTLIADKVMATHEDGQDAKELARAALKEATDES